MFTRNVRTGRTQRPSDEIRREKSGKNDVASPAFGPAAARISASRLSSPFIPPVAATAYHATPITIVIFRANWKRSVHRTPQRPPSPTYLPVERIRTSTQVARGGLPDAA